MFTAFSQVPLPSLPQFETRKALVIINLQNDSLYFKDGIFITKNREFVPRLKEMIPYFRRHGDIIWVCTHMGVLASAPSPDAAQVQRDTETQADKNRKAQKIKEQQMQDDARKEEAARRAKLEKIDPNASGHQDYPSFYPSSKSKDLMTRASAETRAEKRTADLQVMNDDKNEAFEKHLSKPRKGQQSRFYIAGTWGAEICDELLEVVDEEKDLIVYKHHYSAFDQTSLLTALRTKLVTEVYLCGCLTNVGVYSTAADAVQHGLQVTVVEDCLGYRSEEKHEEAMRQMADIMGVSGIDCEEIIEESGGRPVPDAETPGITLDELNLNAEGKDAEAGSMMAGVISGSQAEAASLLQNAAREASDQRTRQNEGLKATTRQQPFASAATADEPSHGRGKVVSREEIVPTPSPGPSAPRNRISWIASRSHTLGPNDSIGSGDSRVIYNVISFSTISDAFAQLKDEVSWQTMFHRTGQVPRLVAVQGEVGANGEEPIYRHPADESPPLLPFTPMVQKLRRELEAVLKQSFNHALIQLYRDGVDNISEHSDKTLDIVRGSSIVNMSIGAQRDMTLRTKRSKRGTDSPSMRQSQRIKMPHNSVFVLGPRTNREWLHGVRADKRPAVEKTDDEKAFGGERISITFRQIGTFINKTEKTIWGSGAKSKTRSEARKICVCDNAQMESMINAFGKENHDTNFDWDAEYGPGFDVINLVDAQAKLTLCSDQVANIRVQLCLYEKSIPFTVIGQQTSQPEQPKDLKTRFHPWTHGLTNSENPLFRDIDQDGSPQEGDLSIMFYLEKRYPFGIQGESASSQPENKSGLMIRTSQANELLFLWREMIDSQGRSSPPTHRYNLERPTTPDTPLHEEFHKSLKEWEARAGEAEYIAGNQWSIIDCAFWPVLNYIIANFDGLKGKRYPKLLAYHKRVLERDSAKTILAKGL